MTRSSTVLIYSLRIDGDRTYPAVLFHLWSGREESVALRIAGCVGNAAGYRNEGIARDVMAKFVKLRDLGHEFVLATCRVEGPKLDLRWQEFRSGDGAPSYCAHTIEAHGGFDELAAQLSFAGKVGRLVEKARCAKRNDDERRWYGDKPEAVSGRSFDNPTEVIAAIEAMGARRVVLVNSNGGSPSWGSDNEWVYDRGGRIRLFTDEAEAAAAEATEALIAAEKEY